MASNFNRRNNNRGRPWLDPATQHVKLVEKYEKLIPIVKFKKNDTVINEFGLSECTVCMDPFVESSKLRKLPTCKHLFHEKCLMQWLSGAQQQQHQKCPMCNAEITLELIQEALNPDNDRIKDS